MVESTPRILMVRSSKQEEISSEASHSKELAKALKFIGANIKIIEPDKNKLSLLDAFLYVRSIRKKANSISDVIHVRSLRLAYLMSFPFLKPNAPIVLEANGIWLEEHGTKGLKRALIRHMENKSIKNARAIVCVAPQIAKEYISRGFKKDKFYIVENGVNPDKFKQVPDAKVEICNIFRIPIESPVILFVGQFYAWQGIDVLINAMKHIVNRIPNAKLLLVGFGQEEGELKSLVKDLQLNKNVVFTGRQNHELIPSIISASDVCVSLLKPTKFGSLKMWEYLACGKPVVASKIEAYSFIEKEKCGVLVEYGNEKKTAEALLSILTIQEQTKEMGANARNFVLKGHTWDITASSILKICKQITQ
jgi:glycosyltransferase involved in cell wall biosynthesis